MNTFKKTTLLALWTMMPAGMALGCGGAAVRSENKTQAARSETSPMRAAAAARPEKAKTPKGAMKLSPSEYQKKLDELTDIDTAIVPGPGERKPKTQCRDANGSSDCSKCDKAIGYPRVNHIKPWFGPDSSRKHSPRR